MRRIKFILLIFFLIFNIKAFSQSSGTGFAILKEGYIVTCYHVVKNAREIIVKGFNNDFSIVFKAEVFVIDEDSDLAILKIKDYRFKGFNKIPYSIKNDIAEVGEEVFTLGYPLISTMGKEIKLTTGIISSQSGFKGDRFSYQTTTPIQRGNSGGPLFDKNGNVVGIINAKHLEADNAGYAIKSTFLINLIKSAYPKISLHNSNSLEGKSLIEQVKLAKSTVLYIEVDWNKSTAFESDYNTIVTNTRIEAKLRDKPNPASAIISTIPKDEKVNILGSYKDYWKVFYSGKLGFINEVFLVTNEDMRLLKAMTSFNVTPNDLRNGESTKTKMDAKLRNGPNPWSELVKIIPQNEEVLIIGFLEGYWKVYHNGEIGYLNELFVDVTLPMVLKFRRKAALPQ